MQVTCQRHRAVSDNLAGKLDEIGVYLIVTVTDETFENGFLQVRNRDNTLQVFITNSFIIVGTNKTKH